MQDCAPSSGKWHGKHFPAWRKKLLTLCQKAHYKCAMSNELMSIIETAAKERGLSARTLCRKARVGGNFIDRLASGGRCWPETAQKVTDWIESNPPGAGKKGSAK